MTSSATSTSAGAGSKDPTAEPSTTGAVDEVREGGGVADAGEAGAAVDVSEAGDVDATASAGGRSAWPQPRAAHGVFAAVVIVGWLAVLMVNHWTVGAPVVFLCLGWLAILLAGVAFWRAAEVAAETDSSGFFEPDEPEDLTRQAELLREKRALLKAIKDVEFDRDMGKMSERDASEIVSVYRARAVEVLKALDRIERGTTDGAEPGDDSAASPVSALIEREVRARLAVASGSRKKGPKR